MKKIILSSFVVLGLGMSAQSCVTPGEKTAIGGGIGAGVGAGIGAIIGNQSGKAGKGAAIGGVIGGVLGGTIGNRLDKQKRELEALEQVEEARRTEQGLVAKLKGDILFATGSSSLRGPAQSNISQIASIMSKYPENVITIEGHTDSTGSDRTNMSLSQKRANSVKQQLVAGGIPSATIMTVGKGETSPTADNTTNQGRQQNRRVEMHIAVDASKVPQ